MEELKVIGTTENAEVAFSNKKEILVSTEIIAPRIEAKASIDFVAVIDKSGSMSGSPFRLVKQSLKFVVKNLSPNDQFCIVTFGSDCCVEMTLTKMNTEGKKHAFKIIDEMLISGRTNLSGGLLMGVEEILKNSKNLSASTSILLLTDGYANIGITDSKKLVSALKIKTCDLRNPVSVFTFGFGIEHDPSFMRDISDSSKGMYYFIETASQIPVTFAECLGGLLSVFAQDIKLEITTEKSKNITVSKVLSNFKSDKISDNKTIVYLDDLYSEEKRNIPVYLNLPALKKEENLTKIVSFKVTYSSTHFGGKKVELDSVSVSISRPKKESDEIDEEQLQSKKDIDEQRNRIMVAEAIDEATNIGMTGKLVEARQVLTETLNQIENSISKDSNYSQSLIRDLSEALGAMQTKQQFDHIGSKYLYSLSRSHYNQRSAGISVSNAAAYMTSMKQNLMDIVNGKEPSQNNDQNNNQNNPPQNNAPENKKNENVELKNNNNNQNIDEKKNEDQNLIKIPENKKNGFSVENSRNQNQIQIISQSILAKSIRRLTSDLIELTKNPLELITAQPLEENFFEWHANVMGPPGTAYDGIVFHMILIFPQTYPIEPPKLFFSSYIEHEHVYGSWICLDMLEEKEWSSDTEVSKAYTGWSSAYSVVSILHQLQAFLFEKANYSKSSIEKARQDSLRFHCDICGHCNKNIWPAFKIEKKEIEEKKDFLNFEQIDKRKREIKLLPGQKICSLLNRSETPKNIKIKYCDQILKKENPQFEIFQHSVNKENKQKIEPQKIVNQPKIEQNQKIIPKGNFVPKSRENQPMSKSAKKNAKRAQKKSENNPVIQNQNQNQNQKTMNPKAPIFVPKLDQNQNQIQNQNQNQNPKKNILDLSLFFEIFEQTKEFQNSVGLGSSFFSFLIDEICLHLFSYLNLEDIFGSVCYVSKDFLKLSRNLSLWKFQLMKKYPGVEKLKREPLEWKNIMKNEKEIIKRELICFHSKLNYNDTVLGIPINIEKRNGKIENMNSTLDLISHESYSQDGIRKTVMKEEFSHWMPLFINKEHAERGFSLLKNSLIELSFSGSNFNPEMFLSVLPKLMNSMVVSLMKGEVHASIRALEGYCAFHRLLLFAVEKFPQLKQKINDIAKNFINSENNRTKQVVPALGEFLPLISVADEVSWSDVSFAYLQENFDRNALWTLKKYPELQRIKNQGTDMERLEKTFDATQVSIRLLIYHVFFFNNVAKPVGKSLQDISDQYDSLHGRPTTFLKELLQQKVKIILGCSTWPQFFAEINLPSPSAAYVTNWLEESIVNSENKGYHNPNAFNRGNGRGYNNNRGNGRGYNNNNRGNGRGYNNNNRR